MFKKLHWGKHHCCSLLIRWPRDPRNVQGITDAKGLEESPRQLSLGLQVYKAQRGLAAQSHKLLDNFARYKGV